MRDEEKLTAFHPSSLIPHPSSLIPFLRRGAGVAELAALEMLCTGNRTVGSNPTLSATQSPLFLKAMEIALTHVSRGKSKKRRNLICRLQRSFRLNLSARFG